MGVTLLDDGKNNNSEMINSDTSLLNSWTKKQVVLENEKKHKSERLSYKSIKRVWPKVQSLIICLSLVFYFEYSILTCFADRIGLHVLN